ncbi:MAG: GNAT family N-acetyltransferase, partial [Candidatus Cloacimonetes bacterium]|nr:GNAT family N-acetyltransferase [Candidatus Cloacimonadota bacterium]
PDLGLWSKFVASHAQGNIFQTPFFFRVYQESNHYRPGVIAVIDEDNRIRGLLSYQMQQEGSGWMGILSTRSVIMGGPLITDDDSHVAELLLQAYEKEISSRVIYSQFRNLFDMEAWKPLFLRNKYRCEDHLNIIIDLTQSEQELWKQVYPKRRNEIRRAVKEGTSVRLLEGNDEIQEALKILENVYGRVKLPLAAATVFQAASRILAPLGMIRFFGAVNSGRIIGTIVVLCYKNVIYDWYAGSYREHYDKYPNDILPWEVFLWGRETGYEIFDFGGAGKPGIPYGVRDYKKKYGGSLVNYSRFIRIHKPLLYQIARTGFSIWQKLQ